ncbi:MAG: hypothetical protein RIG84_19100 [Roseovarius sp.]
MTALLLNDSSVTCRHLKRVDLSSELTEKWLQELIFDNPEVLPLEEIELGSGQMVPLCRELRIPKAGGNVFLDILGVTARGRLVLVECKLWRNPQARREVVAQILEYAAHLRRWSYADLTAQLKNKQGWKSSNPIHERVIAAGAEVEEAAFSDAVAQSLRTGDFDLVVAGDGIREDMAAIAEHLHGQGARLALLEFQVWSDETGRQLVVPQIPFKSEVHKQRIVVDQSDNPVTLANAADEESEDVVNPDRASRNAEKRAFWQRFIEEIEFDHPDQPKPRHGGTNWVKILLPGGSRLTAFRTQDTVGIFLPKSDDSGAYNRLRKDKEALLEELGRLGVKFSHEDANSLASIGIFDALETFPNEEAQLAWLNTLLKNPPLDAGTGT